jgi:hypothetical protein
MSHLFFKPSALSKATSEVVASGEKLVKPTKESEPLLINTSKKIPGLA